MGIPVESALSFSGLSNMNSFLYTAPLPAWSQLPVLTSPVMNAKSLEVLSRPT